MIFSESSRTTHQLEILMGKPIEINRFSLKAIGSSGFYLKEFFNNKSNSNDLSINSRCNFQKFERGFVLRSSMNTKVMIYPILYQDILGLVLTGGIESVSPIRFSPFWCLLKLGIQVKHARHLALNPKEYSVSELKLQIKTNEYTLELIANGFLKTDAVSFFTI